MLPGLKMGCLFCSVFELSYVKLLSGNLSALLEFSKSSQGCEARLAGPAWKGNSRHPTTQGTVAAAKLPFSGHIPRVLSAKAPAATKSPEPPDAGPAASSQTKGRAGRSVGRPSHRAAVAPVAALPRGVLVAGEQLPRPPSSPQRLRGRGRSA